MTFKPSLDREVGEIHTKVNMLLKIAEKDSGRLDKLESAENKRIGKFSVITAAFVVVSEFGSHYINKLF